MPISWTSLPPHSPARVLSRGISRRQGAHQVAQKLITSDLPAQVLTGVGLPFRSFSEKAGSCSGILLAEAASSSGARSLGPGGLAEPAGTVTALGGGASQILVSTPGAMSHRALSDSPHQPRGVMGRAIRACGPCGG